MKVTKESNKQFIKTPYPQRVENTNTLNKINLFIKTYQSFVGS